MFIFFLAAVLLGTVTEEETAALDEGRERRIRDQFGSEDSLDGDHGRVVEILRKILDAS